MAWYEWVDVQRTIEDMGDTTKDGSRTTTTTTTATTDEPFRGEFLFLVPVHKGVSEAVRLERRGPMRRLQRICVGVWVCVFTCVSSDDGYQIGVSDRVSGDEPANHPPRTSTTNTGLTVDQYDGLADILLVVELGLDERLVDEGAHVGGLVPAHGAVVNVDLAQAPHHVHLVLGAC